ANEFAARYDVYSAKYVIEFPYETQTARVQELLPAAIKADAIVRNGLVVRNVQSGITAGDFLYGCWAFYDSGGSPNSTFAFVGRSDRGEDMILTSNHCSVQAPWIYTNNHW